MLEGERVRDVSVLWLGRVELVCGGEGVERGSAGETRLLEGVTSVR